MAKKAKLLVGFKVILPAAGGAAHLGGALATLALLAHMLVSPVAASVDDIRGVLANHAVPVPETELETSLEEAFIRAIDPGARILPAPPTTHSAPPSETAALSGVEDLPGNILYLPMKAFNGQAAEAINLALSEWAHAPGAGIILDIRNAGGSDLDDLDAVAGTLLAPGETLYTITDGRQHVLETRSATGPEPATNTSDRPPCIVLIGTNTLDAAEIFAASLVARRGIMLIGAPTLGRAALRDSLPLPDGRVLIVATRWVSPFERPAFQGTGVKPHLEVDNAGLDTPFLLASMSIESIQRPPSEKVKLRQELLKRVAGDAALRRATDLLLSLQALKHRDAADSGTASAEDTP